MVTDANVTRGRNRRRQTAAGLFVAALCLALLDLFDSAAWAAEAVELRATINQRSMSEATEARPLRLVPSQPAAMTVEVHNGGRSEVEVREVRLEGRVIGLPFFSYDTHVSLKVPAAGRDSIRFDLDLRALKDQATGLIPGSVQVLGPDREILARQDGVFDVRGSLRSIYGLFGLGIAFLTLYLFGFVALDLARHRLPGSRVHRALRFLTPGVGVGLLANFTLSATRVFVPTLGRSLTIVLVCAAAMFALGYLTPHPLDDEEIDDEEIDDRDDSTQEASRPVSQSEETSIPPHGAETSSPTPPVS